MERGSHHTTAASVRRVRSAPRRAALVLGALLALAPSTARADDAAEAQLHFQLGAMRYQQSAYAEALTHFLHAHRLAPTSNTVFNVAQTYLALHQESEAFRFYSDYLARPDTQPAPRAVATRVLGEITPRLCRLDVRATPAGATIFVDRPELGDVGVTPRVIAVAPGPHEVILRSPGHHEARRRIEAVRGEQVVVELALAPIVGTLRIATTPPGATVEVDGAATPSVTPAELSLPAGAHRVRLRREGYLDVLRDVTVSESGAALDERLPRDLATASVLSVTSTPPGASLTLRGEPLGTAPVSRDTSAGNALLRVELDGHAPWEREVLLRPGRALDVRVSLGRRDAHRPWWIPGLTFGGAAVTAAGLVLGAFALTAHSEFDQSPDRAALDRTHQLNLATDVTLGVGLAMVVAGVVAWVLTPDPAVSRAVLRQEGLREQR